MEESFFSLSGEGAVDAFFVEGAGEVEVEGDAADDDEGRDDDGDVVGGRERRPVDSVLLLGLRKLMPRTNA